MSEEGPDGFSGGGKQERKPSMHRILEGVIGRWSTRRRTAYSGLILGIALAVATAGIAVADNLIVDGDGLVPVASSSMNLESICVGQSKSGNALLAIERVGSGQVYANNAAVTVSAGAPSGDASVSTSFADNGIGLPANWTGATNGTMSSDTAASSVTVNTAGSTLGAKSATVVYSASGTRSTGGTLTRTATLTINWSVISCDSTPPVIVPTVTGTAGDNGWYTSDVSVSWSVTDPESAISSTSGCGATTVSSDTTGQTLTCEATSLGGTNSESVTVKRDTVAPTIGGSASPAPNGHGWNNSDVTVDFTCADATSGIASCGPDQTLSGDGVGQSASGTAVDEAGNLASATVSGINIDKMSPEVSVSGVTHGGHYYLGSVPAAGCSTSDNLSGVATPASLSVSGGTGPGVGTFVATCGGAVDRAGNAGAAASATYTVGFHYSGLFRPVDNLPTINRAKAGSAIPVKFSLNGNWGLNVLAAGFPKALLMTCPGSAQVDQVEETVAASSSGLQYDAASDQYTYVWKTDSKWGNTCRQLVLRLADGTEVVTHFTFTR